MEAKTITRKDKLASIEIRDEKVQTHLNLNPSQQRLKADRSQARLSFCVGGEKGQTEMTEQFDFVSESPPAAQSLALLVDGSVGRVGMYR